MKKLLLPIGFVLIGLFTACSSAEGDELVDYQNGYVENVVNKTEEVDQKFQESLEAQTMEEMIEMQENEVMPMVSEIGEYIDDQEPETDDVKEYHDMRAEEMSIWEEAFDLRFEALEKMANNESDQEVDELIAQSDEKLDESDEIGMEVEQKLGELVEEYNLEFEEE
ncbi:hypothetical protein KFZ56_13220 [Virgibacillus sp. NKC19-3]|uniref:hypothetical protein n=1 Tax=Virgibacillus saliphilus TaxID=2831674 RepID=UPI001C9A60B0|nr:hypothetical protein [Virgibacillus sp. NKC19-3]MBY7143987.1 hypothetical protein [Virgibacillus sp. NKC19-3]